MHKKIFCLGVVIILAFFLLTISCVKESPDIYIFEDINECSNISNLTHSNGYVTEYENPNNDKNLKDLKYNDFYAAIYESEELKFEIYAYEFDSPEAAKNYFKNVTGKSTDSSTTFSSSKGMSTYRLVVIDHNCAYTVLTSHDQSETINKSLSEIFSRKIIYSDGELKAE